MEERRTEGVPRSTRETAILATLVSNACMIEWPPQLGSSRDETRKHSQLIFPRGGSRTTGRSSYRSGSASHQARASKWVWPWELAERSRARQWRAIWRSSSLGTIRTQTLLSEVDIVSAWA